MTPELQAKIDAYEAPSSTADRGSQAAGLTGRHFMAQVVGIISYLLMLVGFGLAIIALFWN